MITHIQGKMVEKNPDHVVVECNGLGYHVNISLQTFSNIPDQENLKLYTHLVIREDAHILFGFSTETDRSLFRTLIKVNGVGPKLALTILSGQSAEEFHRCIHDSDTQALVRLPGVGKKTAERLVIEMRDRLPDLVGSNDTDAINIGVASRELANPKQEAVNALCSLGYKPLDASKMVQNISADGKSCEDIIRLALQGALR